MYTSSLILKAKALRHQGKTFSEINNILNTNIPKSTLSTWFKNVEITRDYYQKVKSINSANLSKAREIANKNNKIVKISLYLNIFPI